MTKCVEPDLAESKELEKQGWGVVLIGRRVYNTVLIVGDLVGQFFFFLVFYSHMTPHSPTGIAGEPV